MELGNDYTMRVCVYIDKKYKQVLVYSLYYKDLQLFHVIVRRFVQTRTMSIPGTEFARSIDVKAGIFMDEVVNVLGLLVYMADNKYTTLPPLAKKSKNVKFDFTLLSE